MSGIGWCTVCKVGKTITSSKRPFPLSCGHTLVERVGMVPDDRRPLIDVVMEMIRDGRDRAGGSS